MRRLSTRTITVLSCSCCRRKRRMCSILDCNFLCAGTITFSKSSNGMCIKRRVPSTFNNCCPRSLEIASTNLSTL
ncbi:hypothetical protein PUN28_008387 [Cardiocondyla obscurior]|uniref:Secreted protein n=1 Tax=Cardiocondyla obscurior TaxID=286306 RepID=A0AAW2G2Q8_9HYME